LVASGSLSSNGSIQHHKERLVAQGFHQTAKVNFLETFSPVIKPTTIRIMLTIAVSKGWVIQQLDINNACTPPIELWN